MFGQDVSWVLGSWNVVELQDLGCDGFSCAMVRERIVSFHDLGVGYRGSVDDGLVVAKHHGWSVDGDSKVSEGVAKVHDLLSCGASCDVLGSKGGCLNSRLKFAEPVDRSLVCQVKDSGDGATTDEVMVEVGVHIGSEDDSLSEWLGSVCRQ